MGVSLEKLFEILLKQAIDIDQKAEIKSKYLEFKKIFKFQTKGHQGIYVRVQ